MKFENFIKMGLVKKRIINKNLATSLKKMAKFDLKFLERNKIDYISARKMVAGYYDVLRELLEALAAIKGYKIYSHEAFVYFLDENGDGVMSKKFDRFRLIRNKINYYGRDISVEEAKEYCSEIKKIINYFMGKLENEKI